MTARGDAMMDLYTVAEEAYFAHADTVSTNGIGAAVDAVLDELRAQVKARRTDAWNAHHMTDASDCSQRDFTEGAAETWDAVLALLDGTR